MKIEDLAERHETAAGSDQIRYRDRFAGKKLRQERRPGGTDQCGADKNHARRLPVEIRTAVIRVSCPGTSAGPCKANHNIPVKHKIKTKAPRRSNMSGMINCVRFVVLVAVLQNSSSSELSEVEKSLKTIASPSF